MIKVTLLINLSTSKHGYYTFYKKFYLIEILIVVAVVVVVDDVVVASAVVTGCLTQHFRATR